MSRNRALLPASQTCALIVTMAVFGSEALAAQPEAPQPPAPDQAAAPAPAVAEEAPNPLVPPGQEERLGKHPIANDKNTYKPGSGMHLESEDGAFALTTRLRAQFRYQLDHDPNVGPDEDELSHVFQIRRARLQFKGHAFSKHNKFKAEMAFSPRDLGMKDGVPHNTPLLSWYAELTHLRDATVRMGQYKIPYSRQRVVSSGDTQFVDRALANGEFNHDRDIGLDLRSKDLFGLGGYLHYYAGVYMGEGRDFGDKNATPDFKLHYLARVEVLPMGKFVDYREADIERTTSPKLSLGGAYGYYDDSQKLRGTLGSRAIDGGTTDYHSMTVDYVLKYAGFATSGEFHWRHGTRNPGDATLEDPSDPSATIPAPVQAARNGYGWWLQAGYLIPRVPLEVAARYSGIRAIGDEDPGDLAGNADGFTSLGRKDSVGIGLSYYFAGHPLKLATDYFRTWSDGVLLDGVNSVRTQLQLAF
jgi:hypothetical protein